MVILSVFYGVPAPWIEILSLFASLQLSLHVLGAPWKADFVVICVTPASKPAKQVNIDMYSLIFLTGLIRLIFSPYLGLLGHPLKLFFERFSKPRFLPKRGPYESYGHNDTADLKQIAAWTFWD